MSIRIPASIDEAVSSLNGLAALLTAKQWERAAIVYAFTEPGNGGPRTGLDQGQLSLREFAELGISGLRRRERVSAYRDAWQSAIDQGKARALNPGNVAELPDLPWEDFFLDPAPTSVVQRSAFRAVVSDPEQFRAALRDAPEIVEAVTQRIMEVPATRVMAEAKLAEPIREREVSPEPRPEPRRDYEGDAIRGISLLVPGLRAVTRGEWQPSPAITLLFHAVGQLLQEARSEGEPQDDLFRQIERYMKEEVR